MGAVVCSCLACWKAMSWADVQRKSLRVLRSGRSGTRTDASSLVQVVSWLVRPI